MLYNDVELSPDQRLAAFASSLTTPVPAANGEPARDRYCPLCHFVDNYDHVVWHVLTAHPEQFHLPFDISLDGPRFDPEAIP